MADLSYDGYLSGYAPKTKTTTNRSPRPQITGTRTNKNTSSSSSSSTSSGSTRYSPPQSVPSKPVGSGYVQNITLPKPKPPSIKKYLAGDDVYQQALRGGNRSMQDFLSDLNRRKNESKLSFKQVQEQMNRDRDLTLDQMRQEFASRGLIHSGLFAKERGTFEEEFLRQMQQLEQAQTAFLGDLTSQKTNYQREYDLSMEAARQEAIRRRASKYNLGF